MGLTVATSERKKLINRGETISVCRWEHDPRFQLWLKQRCSAARSPGQGEHRGTQGAAAKPFAIFVKHSATWGGGVASVTEVTGKDCHGSLVYLDADDFQTLTGFEGGYTSRGLLVTNLATGVNLVAQTFVADDPSFQSPPSEAYKAAIWSHLVDVGWPIETWCGLTVRRVVGPGEVEALEEWKMFPPVECALETLAVLVNNHPRKEARWTMPKRVPDFVALIHALGATSSAELMTILASSTDEEINQRLSSCAPLPHLAFSPNTSAILRELLTRDG